MGTPANLLAHLTAALAEVVPGFGAGLAYQASTETLAADFCNEADATVVDDLVLILDDVHLLAGTDADSVPSMLFRDLPPSVRLAMAGRSLPSGLPAETGPGVVVIDERRLALDVDEATALVAGAGLNLPPERLERLHAQTEGWAAGLMIAAQAGRGDVGTEDGHDMLFGSLADDVLARTEPRVRRFMADTSVLSRMTPRLAAAVAGGSPEDARGVLDSLADRHLFTQRIAGPGGWFRYHHLLGRHLRDRLGEEQPGRVPDLHGRAASAWEAEGEPLEALRHQASAGDIDRLADMLDRYAESLVRGPGRADVARWIDRIPRDLRSERPGLLLASATLLNTSGEFERAFEATDEAVGRLLDLGEHERAAIALVGLLLNMLTAGTPPARRIISGERCLARLEAVPARPVARVAHAMGLAFGGRTVEARRQLALALSEADDDGYPVGAYARIIDAFYLEYPRGRGERAVELLEWSAAELLADPSRDPFGFGMFAVAYEPYVLNSLGRHEDALFATERFVTAMKALAMGEQAERPARWWRLTALAGLERWDDLASMLGTATPASAGVHAGHYGYRYRSPAALLAAHHGEADTVMAEAQAAIAAMKEHGPAFDQPWILCDLSRAARVVRLDDLAAELAEAAHRQATVQDLPWGRARAALRLSLAVGAGPRGDAFLAEALAITEEEGFIGLWSRRERADAGEALARAIADGVGRPGGAPRLAAACGPRVIVDCTRRLAAAPPRIREAFAREVAGVPGVPAEALEVLMKDRSPEVREAARTARTGASSHAPPLRHRCLGGFAVERGGLSVDRSAFGREKARMLLGALLCAGGPVHREVLLEWLWPDLDLDRGMRAFHVTVHALRRALEPELARGAASSVVVNEDESYRVVLRDGDTFDLAEFLAVARPVRGEERLRRLERLLSADEAWTGTPYPEWPYAAWADAPRAEAERVHAEVLASLADALIEDGRPSPAVSRARRLVEREPEREEWHRLLMRAYAAAGERALALRQFHACRTVLRRELGIDVSQASRDLYRQILISEDDVEVEQEVIR
ncbi:MAG: BTAD domain-containing putative transcriptional regulator [Thermoleophilia bacterium]